MKTESVDSVTDSVDFSTNQNYYVRNRVGYVYTIEYNG